jgi:hypothetical protein
VSSRLWWFLAQNALLTALQATSALEVVFLLMVKIPSLLVGPVIDFMQEGLGYGITSVLLLVITVLGNICAVSEYNLASTVLSAVVAYMASVGILLDFIDYLASIWPNDGLLDAALIQGA